MPGCGRKSPGSYRGVTEQCRDLGVHKAYPGLALVDPGATRLYGVSPAQPGSPWINPGASQVYLGCSLALGWGWGCKGCMVWECVRGLTECGVGWDSGAVTVVMPMIDRA